MLWSIHTHACTHTPLVVFFKNSETWWLCRTPLALLAVHERKSSPCQENVKLYELWCLTYDASSFLELCLTSNVKCGTVESYKKHHFIHLFTAKHPIVLGVSINQKNSYHIYVTSAILNQRSVTPLDIFISKWEMCSRSITCKCILLFALFSLRY